MRLKQATTTADDIGIFAECRLDGRSQENCNMRRGCWKLIAGRFRARAYQPHVSAKLATRLHADQEDHMIASRARHWLTVGAIACWAAFVIWSHSARYTAKQMSPAALRALCGAQPGNVLGCPLNGNSKCKPDSDCVNPSGPNVVNPGCYGTCLKVGDGCGDGKDQSTGNYLTPLSYTNADGECSGCGFDKNDQPLCPNTGCYNPDADDTVLCVDNAYCECVQVGVDGYGRAIPGCRTTGDQDGPDIDEYRPACFSATIGQ